LPWNTEHCDTLLHGDCGALSAEKAARRLGITPEVGDKRRHAGTPLAAREGSDWRYPACQFQRDRRKGKTLREGR
jgi:hypothetical protein